MSDVVLQAVLTGLLLLAVEVIKRRLPSADKRSDEIAEYRKELREDLVNTKLRINELEKENETKDTLISELTGKIGVLTEQVLFWKQRFRAVDLERQRLEQQAQQRRRPRGE